MPEPYLALAREHPPTPAEVAAAITRCLSPSAASLPPPSWLRPDQRASFGRGAAALEARGAVLFAEPVGSGKTWIALALARASARRPAAIVPAALVSQWERASHRAGVALTIQSHEAWSRGARPLDADLVIVDESHRLRHSGIRRYLALAPVLTGRRVVLLTATPVVNRLDDLTAQLLLGLRDDALAPSGVPSLAAALGTGVVPLALAEVVVTACPPAAGPRRVESTVPATAAEDVVARRAWRIVSQLRLSPDPRIRRLLRGLLAQALASGPAAAIEVLRRYRRLLRQAEDAAAAGRRVGRRALERAFAGDAAQLVLWELLGDEGAPADLATDDIGRLDDAIDGLGALAAEGVPKLDRLRALLADGRPTLVFAAYRATVADLRRRLEPRSRIAWCTGAAAGIGPSRLSRETVLDWFRPGGPEAGDLAPNVLVATDVAAEGLDLQRAARVVHYDLPWTAVRLEQRAGRAARLGSSQPEVEVVRLEAPPCLEQRLQQGRALRRKAGLARAAGAWAWAWGPREAEGWSGVSARRGVAAAEWGGGTGLAAFEVLRGGGVVGRLVAARVGGEWTAAPEVVAAGLAAARQGRGAMALPAGAGATLRSAAAWARRAADGGEARRAASPEASAARRRVRAWARAAIRARDVAATRMAARAHAMLQRGLTAGERLLAAAIAAAPEADLPALLARAPEPDPQDPHRLRLVGCIHFTSSSG